jgi:hypothetical protein
LPGIVRELDLVKISTRRISCIERLDISTGWTRDGTVAYRARLIDKCLSSDTRHTRGDRDAGEAITIKCIRSDTRHPLWDRDAGEAITLKCLSSNTRHTRGDRDTGELIRGKCIHSDTRHSLWDRDAGEAISRKCITSYTRHTRGDRDAGEEVTLKCRISDTRHPLWDRDTGEWISLKCTKSDTRECARERYTGDSLVIKCIRSDTRHCDSSDRTRYDDSRSSDGSTIGGDLSTTHCKCCLYRRSSSRSSRSSRSSGAHSSSCECGHITGGECLSQRSSDDIESILGTDTSISYLTTVRWSILESSIEAVSTRCDHTIGVGSLWERICDRFFGEESEFLSEVSFPCGSSRGDRIGSTECVS